MKRRIQEVITELARLTAEAKERFGDLSVEQLNWKPDAKSWSVGQCLDHLIRMHSMYFPRFEALESGNPQPSFWERYSPFSGMFGRLMNRSMNPGNRKKYRTAAIAEPSSSSIDEHIVEAFASHQAQLAGHIRNIPPDIDPSITIITSPLSGLVTYSLDDCFTILVVHIQRHFGQAQRVMEQEGFPERSPI